MSNSKSSEYRDVRWQKLRLEVMQRDGWVCCMCKERKNEELLHVHHKIYPKGPVWDIDPYYLATLCEGCHEKVTQLKREVGSVLDDPVLFEGFKNFYCLALTHLAVDGQGSSGGAFRKLSELADCIKTLDWDGDVWSSRFFRLAHKHGLTAQEELQAIDSYNFTNDTGGNAG